MATRTKKDTTTPSTPVTDKLTIPSMVRTTAPATTGVDLLSELAGDVPVAAAPKKGVRAALPLTPQVEKIFEAHIVAKKLADLFGDHSENKKAELKAEIWPLWVDQMWTLKSQPSNATLRTNRPDGKPDCEGMYIIQQKYKIQAKTKEEAVKTLIDLGLSVDNANALVANELDFSPRVSIKFDLLQNGHWDSESKSWVDATPQEQAVAAKALALLLSKPGAEPLTAEDKALLISRDPKVEVKDGFLQRVASYCTTKEQLFNVFKVITPIEMAKGAKFAISDTPMEHNRRIVKEAGDILGVQVVLVESK
jgi:hypothetical protein